MSKQKFDRFAAVTEKLLAKIKEGTLPWRKPFASIVPYNFVSKKPYRGVNYWILSFEDFPSGAWGTYKQIKQAGGQVEKGEKGTRIVFWKQITKPDPTKDDPDNTKTFPYMAVYTVFNVAEQTSLELPSEQVGIFDPFEACTEIVDGYTGKPPVQAKARPFYSPKHDYIGMPTDNSFDCMQSKYMVLFHEYAHSTGHPDRLGRFSLAEPDIFGSGSYSQEELVAELSAAMLGQSAGILGGAELDNSAAYINGWWEVLSKDNKMFVYAAQQAQKATDHILGTTFS